MPFIPSILLGLVLFLFGCFKLSEKVTQTFNLHLRSYVSKINHHPSLGFLLGFILTAAFQSSTAAIVLAISLVGAGLLTFRASLPFILAAGLASVVTPLLVVFKITNLAPFFIIIGGLFWLLTKGKTKKVSEAVFYFGLLFFGLGIITDAAVFSKQNFFREIFISSNPFFGFLVGLILTVLFQASAVPLSILAVLGSQGLVGIGGALPIILGINLGAISTEVFSSFATRAKRVGLSIFFFKLFGIIIFFPFLNQFSFFLTTFFKGAGQVLAAHFFFNFLLSVVFLFLLTPFCKMMKKIMPEKEAEIYLWPVHLNKKILNDPPQVFLAVKREFSGMMTLIKKMFEESIENIFQFKENKVQQVEYKEKAIDNIQSEILKFLDKIPKENLKKEEAQKIIIYAEITDKLERIADRIMNLNTLASLKKSNKVNFSTEAMTEIKEISSLVKNRLLFLEKIILREPILEEEVRPKSDSDSRSEIEEKIKKSKNNHLERFWKRKCTTADGSIFNNILINFREIVEHLERVVCLMNN